MPPETPPEQKKRKPMGKPIEWTEADIEKMSEVTPEDIEQAAERWREVASPKYKNLLDAQETDDTPGA